MDPKPDICQLNMEELKAVLTGMGEAGFRAAQVYDWLHRRGVSSFSGMSNLPKTLRERLDQEYRITRMDAAEVYVSRIDGTRKYVFALWDGNAIEAVLMRYRRY